MTKLKKELESFQTIWQNGFHCGWDTTRNQKGLEDFIKEDMKGKRSNLKVCLEIGCGGGQWSKFIYDLNIFDKIYCIDALSAKHNNFWQYVGEEEKYKIEYYKVEDFNLNFIKEKELDYVFSYDVFCHISLSGIEEYIKNLRLKANDNARFCIMFADPYKYSKSEPHNFAYQQHIWTERKKRKIEVDECCKILIKDCDSDPEAGRWYWIGNDNFKSLLNKYNYKIIKEDLDIDRTNPISYFTL